MIPNFNEKLGYPYGVIALRDLPELADEIFQRGENLSYQDYLAEIHSTVTNALSAYTADEDNVDAGGTNAEAVNLVGRLARRLGLSRRESQAVLELFDSQGYVDSEEVLEAVLEGAGDRYHGDEDVIRLGGYLLSWLGGAAMLTVTSSKYVCYCRPCSPCVPGAGDLNTCSASGYPALCLPPGEWEDAEEPDEIWEILPDGELKLCAKPLKAAE